MNSKSRGSTFGNENELEIEKRLGVMTVGGGIMENVPTSQKSDKLQIQQRDETFVVIVPFHSITQNKVFMK
jgi:hypothetical protein